MKIITWNCNMAFRTKAIAIQALSPDILIIPECESPDKLIFHAGVRPPSQFLWYGANKNKGLGIFCFGGFSLQEMKCHNPELKMIIPIKVNNSTLSFNLYAIWANNATDKTNQYVGQIWKALAHYDKHLSKTPSLLVGDFNSNVIWDKPRRTGNHSHVVAKLLEKNISSCYHHFFGCAQGEERDSTLFLYRHRDKGYHIDYCFASQYFMDKLKTVEIGSHEQWAALSDHVPLSVTFKD